MAVKEMSTKGLQPKLREVGLGAVLRNANHRNIMTLVDVVDDLRTERVYLILSIALAEICLSLFGNEDA